MKSKKEFTVKSYSTKMYPLCIVGVVLAILSDFIRFIVPNEVLTMSYVAIYIAICIIAMVIFIVRSSYDYKKHKKYAILTIASAIVILAGRIFEPHVFTGYFNSILGNVLDFETILTILFIVLIGMPMFDLLQTLKYVQPPQTHISDSENTNSSN